MSGKPCRFFPQVSCIYFLHLYGSWHHPSETAPGKGSIDCLTPPKFNIAPEKWWLEDYFPIGKVTFQGRTVKLREGKQNDVLVSKQVP